MNSDHPKDWKCENDRTQRDSVCDILSLVRASERNVKFNEMCRSQERSLQKRPDKGKDETTAETLQGRNAREVY